MFRMYFTLIELLVVYGDDRHSRRASAARPGFRPGARGTASASNASSPR